MSFVVVFAVTALFGILVGLGEAVYLLPLMLLFRRMPDSNSAVFYAALVVAASVVVVELTAVTITDPRWFDDTTVGLAAIAVQMGLLALPASIAGFAFTPPRGLGRSGPGFLRARFKFSSCHWLAFFWSQKSFGITWGSRSFSKH